jgi:hypothetical protein
MKQYQIFSAIVCTFFITVLAVNNVNKRDNKTKLDKIKQEHLKETDSLKREIGYLEEAIFLKKIVD